MINTRSYKYIKYKNKVDILTNLINQNGGNIYSIDGNQQVEPSSILQRFGVFGQKHLSKIGLQQYATNKVTIEKCSAMGKKSTPADLINFAKTYKLDHTTMKECDGTRSIEECLNRVDPPFSSMNDLFIRSRKGLPLDDPIIRESSKTSFNIVSPADCYATMFENEATAKELWIKGKSFTLDNLFFGESPEIPTRKAFLSSLEITKSKKINSKYGVIIFRLAPHHYHRYHTPVNGRLMSIQKLGTKFLSVQPSLVASSNVYTENVRIILEIKTIANSIIYLAIIGATCVGSIVFASPEIVRPYYYANSLEFKENSTVQFSDADTSEKLKRFNEYLKTNIVNISQNEYLGNFQYGGSTLVCAYDTNVYSPSCKIGNIISDRTKIGRHETEIRVGDVVIVHSPKTL